CIRRQRMMMSISVWFSMWPICSLPVTFGGGSNKVKTGCFAISEPGSGVFTEKSFSLTQYSAQRTSIAAGSYAFGRSCGIRAGVNHDITGVKRESANAETHESRD